MVSAIAEITEKHFVAIGWPRTGAAGLALGALPRVFTALANRVRREVHAAGVH